MMFELCEAMRDHTKDLIKACVPTVQ